MVYGDEGIMSDEEAEELLGCIMGQNEKHLCAVKDSVDVSELQEGVDMVLNNASFVDVLRVSGR